MGRTPGSKNKPRVEKQRISQTDESTQSKQQGPRKFTREMVSETNGLKQIWYYDLDKFANGPYKVENIYPEDWTEGTEDLEKANEDLPLTKRQWLNPKNGKLVSYSRACQLGLYKPEPGIGKRGRPKKN